MKQDFEEVAREEQSSKKFSGLRIEFVPFKGSFIDNFIFWQFIAPNKIELTTPVGPSTRKDAVREYLRSEDNNSLFPPGIFFSQDLIDYLEDIYQEVKECTGKSGKFRHLDIGIMPHRFSCSDSNVASGCFISPNNILLGLTWGITPRAEFLHELLWRNTGDADKEHQEFFDSCVLKYWE